MQARPPAKPARHSPEAQPMADGQGEAACGTSGQVTQIAKILNLRNNTQPGQAGLRLSFLQPVGITGRRVEPTARREPRNICHHPQRPARLA